MRTKDTKKKYVKFRHRFYFSALRPVVRLLARRYRFKTKKFALDKKRNYLILSNHQSFLDPAFIALTIRRPILVVGDERFNGLKYLLFFNRVCEQIVKKGGDKYYGLYPSKR